MKTENIAVLYKTEYRIRFLDVIRQYWKDEKNGLALVYRKNNIFYYILTA